MERIFIDSSAWVALFFDNDENHKKAVTLFKRLNELKCVLHTSDYVVDETLTALLYRSGHRPAVTAGEVFFNSKIIAVVRLEDETVRSAWTFFKKYDDKKFSFTDVTSFVLSKELGIHKAFTFDADFKKAGMETLGI